VPWRVSIPQSGFGAFERMLGEDNLMFRPQFQSLSRDSGRLNHGPAPASPPSPSAFQSLSRDSGRLNVATASENPHGQILFQSLSRDSGRLNVLNGRRWVLRQGSFNPSVGIRGV